MEITKEVIRDLLPLYFENEVSADSRKIIESYFSKHPEFAEEAKKQNLNLESIEIKKINKEEEMVTLQKTKKLVRIRSLIMGFAIFFSMLPFSFGSVSWDNYDGVRWLWSHNPLFAIYLGLIGLGLWTVYFFINRRLSI